MPSAAGAHSTEEGCGLGVALCWLRWFVGFARFWMCGSFCSAERCGWLMGVSSHIIVCMTVNFGDHQWLLSGNKSSSFGKLVPWGTMGRSRSLGAPGTTPWSVDLDLCTLNIDSRSLCENCSDVVGWAP